MRIINGMITGLIAGFITSLFIAPRSGRETRASLGASLKKQWKNLQMTYGETAHKLGLISAQKKAKINKKAVTAYNVNNTRTSADPSARTENASLKKMHEKSSATKAVDSSTAKSAVRKVPVHAK